MLAGGAASTLAEENRGAAFDWQQWRALPVQDGGRQKPLDTLAWETFRTISNKSSFQTHRHSRSLIPLISLFTLSPGKAGIGRQAHGMPVTEGFPAACRTSARRLGPRAAAVDRSRAAALGCRLTKSIFPRSRLGDDRA
jgi:hypothetical protein